MSINKALKAIKKFADEEEEAYFEEIERQKLKNNSKYHYFVKKLFDAIKRKLKDLSEPDYPNPAMSSKIIKNNKDIKLMQQWAERQALFVLSEKNEEDQLRLFEKIVADISEITLTNFAFSYLKQALPGMHII